LLHCCTPSAYPSPFLFSSHGHLRDLHSFPTRRSSDLPPGWRSSSTGGGRCCGPVPAPARGSRRPSVNWHGACLRDTSPRRRKHRSEEHTSELQSRENLVCRLLLEKKKYKISINQNSTN